MRCLLHYSQQENGANVLESITLTAATTSHSTSSTDGTNATDTTILNELLHGPLSRTDLINKTHFPRSTVHASVRRLLEQHDIEEYSLASSTGGRRAALLRISPLHDVADVVELGSHHARLGIAKLTGEVIATADIPLSIDDGPEAIVTLLHTTWKKLHHDNPTLPMASIVGVAVPGPVDTQGVIVGAARMPGWNRTHLTELIEKVTGLPAVVENDARAGAVGEWMKRAETTESSIYIKVGSGIGASWIADGIVFRGHQGFGGELTHTRVQSPNPTICSCGNTGCLETVASGAAMLRHLASIDSPITTVNELIEATQNGDMTAASLVRNAGGYIGEALSGLVNFLNPQHIIIGGSLSQARTLIAGIRSELYQRCLPMSTANLTVDTAISGQDAPLIGMAILARQAKTHLPHP
ncbi:ROK family transcriptional regulator [Arcanobacterium pinnipediorum]|uniref:ROK family transcriptional regulator n=1 Tax=Arcanobacterium pinnipediorum TaxID=1503041 RepID=A0ABY5AJ29_9ACTO|nr:ROK family transcriptional regulator [Arcanobacterium pinnipediorum]USR79441.1 ROK family transcriptional regulator [Arcanobacterium pinnipediorum]